MKKILLLLPFLFVFNGCGDDDEDWQKLDGHPIVGTWKLVDMNFSIKPTTPELEEALKEAIKGQLEGIGSAQITFGADGKYKLSAENILSPTDGTYRVSDSKVELMVDGEKKESAYKINGNKMTVEEDMTATINEENKNQGIKFDKVILIESYERVK